MFFESLREIKCWFYWLVRASEFEFSHF